MGVNVSLEVFEGPLDLLLHLIRKNKLDIYDIPIALVTQQYLDSLDRMREMDIEIASEFLVTAATLLAIKARMLVPRHGGGEEEEEEDPRQELVNQLLEYERFKSLVGLFQQMEEKSSRVHFKPADEDLIQEVAARVNPLEGITCDGLTRMFREILERIPEETEEEVRRISRKDITVPSVMASMLEELKSRPECTFHDLIRETMSRTELVVSFLALLELMRKDLVEVRQAENFGPIRIILKKGNR